MSAALDEAVVRITCGCKVFTAMIDSVAVNAPPLFTYQDDDQFVHGLIKPSPITFYGRFIGRCKRADASRLLSKSKERAISVRCPWTHGRNTLMYKFRGKVISLTFLDFGKIEISIVPTGEIRHKVTTARAEAMRI